MSSALAIASVTYLLKDLLNDALINHDVSSSVTDAVTVTAMPPDTFNLLDKNQISRLNLFMYQATPNQGWHNAALPSRDSRGERLSNPPLALDLHYLLTAYGFDELHSEILLGYGMQLLHETPLLSRAAMRRSLAAPASAVKDPQLGNKVSLPAKLKKLAETGLAEQVEAIKITLQPMGTDEMSKLWSAFQSKYRPSAAYSVSVILIDTSKAVKSPLPVRNANILAMQYSQPMLKEVSPQIVGKSGDTLAIIGQNLKSTRLKVLFGAKAVIPDSGKCLDDRIEVTVPDGLRAGINTVRVVHEIDLRTHELRSFESNAGLFMLRPRITVQELTLPGIAKVDGVTYKSGVLTLSFTPLLGRGQKVALKLNAYPAGNNALTYSFQAPYANGITDPIAQETGTVEFTLDSVEEGTYLMRVEVDGAESELEIKAGTGEYINPKVVI